MKTSHVLKDLAPGQQQRLWEYLKANGGRKAVIFVRNTFKKPTSTSALSEWKSWYQLQLQFHSLDSMRASFQELLLKKFPKADPKTVQEFGQAYFTMQAAASGDSETFREMEKLRLLKEKEAREGNKLGLDREKFEVQTCELFLKWFKDERTRQIANSQSSNAERIAQLRRVWFQDVDALDAANVVKIPA